MDEFGSHKPNVHVVPQRKVFLDLKSVFMSLHAHTVIMCWSVSTSERLCINVNLIQTQR